jgi:hypothetical protein
VGLAESAAAYTVVSASKGIDRAFVVQQKVRKQGG